MARHGAWALMALLAAGVGCAVAERTLLGDHKYKQGDAIMLYANKVGPFQNPT